MKTLVQFAAAVIHTKERNTVNLPHFSIIFCH